uniref:Uncharacterized protein n=1 Tax=Fagus sylvatica TaxID=28930 RepID=A0A2N9EMI3_FAGSY
MAPGSRGVGAVFARFSGEDSDQTGDATGEPRVPRRSRSRYLSNAPGLADQLVASREDSAREGGCPERKNAFYSQRLALPTFARFLDLRESELGLVRYGPANRGHRGVFGPFEDSFPIGIPARPGKILAIREFHVMHECVFFPTCPGSRINLLRVRKTLRASAATSVGKVPEFSAQPYFVGLFSRAWPCTEASLGSQDMILRTEAVGSFDHNFLFSRPFSTRKVSNRRSSHHVLRNGQGAVSSIQLLAWSTVWSNLGQTWSTLGQTWSKLSKLWEMYLKPCFEGFWAWWTLVGLETAWSNLGQPSVNFGQTWSTLGKLGRILGNVPQTTF